MKAIDKLRIIASPGESERPLKDVTLGVFLQFGP
jgi:hypothetical protein